MVEGLGLKPIEDWKKALNFWSVRLGLTGITIEVVLLTLPDMSLNLWGVLPDALKTWVPDNFIHWVPLALFVAGQFARIVRQKNVNNAV